MLCFCLFTIKASTLATAFLVSIKPSKFHMSEFTFSHFADVGIYPGSSKWPVWWCSSLPSRNSGAEILGFDLNLEILIQRVCSSIIHYGFPWVQSRHQHVCVLCVCWSLSRVRLFVTPWTVAHQAPLSMGFSRQNTGVYCHYLLKRIFLTQGLKPRLQYLLH